MENEKVEVFNGGIVNTDGMGALSNEAIITPKHTELANKLFNAKPNEQIIRTIEGEVIFTQKDIENYILGVDLATGKDYTFINNKK